MNGTYVQMGIRTCKTNLGDGAKTGADVHHALKHGS